jgi:hypothetical protein
MGNQQAVVAAQRERMEITIAMQAAQLSELAVRLAKHESWTVNVP